MYYLRFSEHTYVIDPGDCHSDDQWAYRGHDGLSLAVKGICRSKISGWDVKSIDKDDYESCYGVDDIKTGDTAYVVVVEYTTGGTFHTYDTWCVAAVTKEPDKAQEIVKKCYAENDGSTRSTYRSWDGYFESINSAYVEPFIVGP